MKKVPSSTKVADQDSCSPRSPREAGEAGKTKSLVNVLSASKSSEKTGAEQLRASDGSVLQRKSAFGSRMAAPQKKQSLADIFFMSSPLHGHAKRGDLVEINKAVQVRKNSLSAFDFAAWLNANANKNEQSALLVAVQYGHDQAARLLLDLGSSVSLRDINGRTALLYAARYGRTELLPVFWERADPSSRASEADHQGDSMLHLAATHGHSAAVSFCVARGCDVNLANKFGETALHKAARTDQMAMVDLLLSLGADANAMGRDGKARHVAASTAMADRLRNSATTPVSGGSFSASPNSFGGAMGLPVTFGRASPPPLIGGRFGEPPTTSAIGSGRAGEPKGRGTPPRLTVVDVDGDDENDNDDDENNNNDDDDSIEFLNPGVRKVLLGSSGGSADLVHFKLRRAIEKSAVPSVVGGQFDMSDEQLANHHENMRKQSMASLSFEETKGRLDSELAAPLASSGVAVEMSLASGSVPKAGTVSYLFEPYRAMFGARHFNYICKGFLNPPNAACCAMITVVASPDGAFHQGLLRSPSGYTSYPVQVDEVRQEMADNHNMKLEDAIRAVLDRNLQSADDLLAPVMTNSTSLSVPQQQQQQQQTTGTPGAGRKNTTTPKTQRMSVIRTLKNSLKSESTLWQLVEGQALSTELLALELKLGLPKTLSVGVVVFQPGQDEAAAMGNPMPKACEAFMATIASPTEAKGWSGYSGGMSTKESGTFYYTAWRGMEIVFHVAPLLSETQRRQFVGNDKVMLHFLDSWRPGKQVEPKFRGHVNSVAIVVNPVAPPLYKFLAYHRVGMADTKPAFSDDAVQLDHAFRDVLMSKIVNAHVDSYNLLYGERMKRAWLEELNVLGEKYGSRKARVQSMRVKK